MPCEKVGQGDSTESFPMSSNAVVRIISEYVVSISHHTAVFQIVDTPSHAVEGHDDVGHCGRYAACPEDGAVLAVVLD